MDTEKLLNDLQYLLEILQGYKDSSKQGKEYFLPLQLLNACMDSPLQQLESSLGKINASCMTLGYKECHYTSVWINSRSDLES